MSFVVDMMIVVAVAAVRSFRAIWTCHMPHATTQLGPMQPRGLPCHGTLSAASFQAEIKNTSTLFTQWQAYPVASKRSCLVVKLILHKVSTSFLRKPRSLFCAAT